MSDYDIGEAFEAIEDELIASMMRNMKRHRLEENSEDKQWEMWQALQLEALEKYKKENAKKYKSRFAEINAKIDAVIRKAAADGSMDQEIKILEAIKHGFKGYKRASDTLTASFFRLNDRKLEALIKATTDDVKKAEVAILRRANDQYRKIIYNAQVYSNTGAATYETAVDMATKDFLSAGIQCIQYKNGSMHTAADYADMAIRTASKRAYLQGEGVKRQEWGLHLVIVNKRGNPCPLCLPFVGKILIDDVWSGGSSEDGPYKLMSTAVEAGLYHPRCRDSHTTYFPDISTPPKSQTYTKEEIRQIEKRTKQEARQQYAERQAEKYERLQQYSLDPENQERYGTRAEQWRNVNFRTGRKSSKEYAASKQPLANFRATPLERVVEELRRDAKDWLRRLTDKEKHAISKYTFNAGDEKNEKFFKRLNAMLRGDLKMTDQMQEYADTISGAIRKTRLKRDVICYRGVDKDIYADKAVGDTFVATQFTSVSVVPKGALDKPYKIVIYANKGIRAAYIENLSHSPNQREILIDKGVRHRVISKREGYIELEAMA